MRYDERIHNASSRSSMKGDCPLANFQLAVQLCDSQINNGPFIGAEYRLHALSLSASSDQIRQC